MLVLGNCVGINLGHDQLKKGSLNLYEMGHLHVGEGFWRQCGCDVDDDALNGPHWRYAAPENGTTASGLMREYHE